MYPLWNVGVEWIIILKFPQFPTLICYLILFLYGFSGRLLVQFNASCAMVLTPFVTWQTKPMPNLNLTHSFPHGFMSTLLFFPMIKFEHLLKIIWEVQNCWCSNYNMEDLMASHFVRDSVLKLHDILMGTLARKMFSQSLISHRNYHTNSFFLCNCCATPW